MLLAREGQELLGQLGAALCRLHRALEELHLLSTGDAGGKPLEIAEERRQQVVEIMRDAAGELADRLHLLALPQRFFRLLLLGDIARADEQLADAAIGIADRDDGALHHPLAGGIIEGILVDDGPAARDALTITRGYPLREFVRVEVIGGRAEIFRKRSEEHT